MYQLLFCALFAMLVACATSPPDAIRETPPGNPSLADVRHDISAYIGKRIRWGGRIAAVENRTNETWIDVVVRPLDSSGRPQLSDESPGRFLVRINGFLDPAIYTKDRLVTVAGPVEQTLKRPIGEYPYSYVLIKADTIKLWEQPVERPLYYSDPFYDPFWSVRPYPWYGPYPFYPYWR